MIYKLVLILTVVSTAAAYSDPDPIDCPEKYTYQFEDVYFICLTKDKYANTDRKSAEAYCKSIGGSLCSLDSMSDAWRRDYLDMRWGMYDAAGRDARVSSCTERYTGEECHTRTTFTLFPTDIIPNTPRPNAMQPAYCCGYM